MKQSSVSSVATLKKVFRYLKHYRLLLAISLILATVVVILTLYLPILFGEAVDTLVGPGQVNAEALWPLLQRAVIVIGITAVATWLMNICNNRITFGMVRRLRHDAFEHIQSLPLSYLDRHPVGDMVSRIVSDAEQVTDGLLMGFSQFFTGVLTIIGTLVFMLTINIPMTVLTVLITPLSLFVASFIAKRTHSLFRKQAESRAVQTDLIEEMVGSHKVVVAFSHEDEALESFDAINDQLHRHSLLATFFSSLTNPSTRFVNNLVYAAVALSGALFCLLPAEHSLYLSVGALSAFLSYATQYTKPFNEISGVVTELQNALACSARLFELMEAEPQIPDAPDAVSLASEDVTGQVDLDHVDFSYTPDKPLIRDFDLHITEGQHVAIVGPTGCGKSTVINLLMRFYDVNNGCISVSGHDIRDLTRASLRSSYGMVLQETWLSSASVRDNIAIGRPDATDEEIVAAAKSAHADSFIRRLPNGYDTVLGEDGSPLSQGQKQLLCIARIFLALPPMLILDEATSSIDTRTELKIQSAFAKLMEGHTTFIVAHRLSTIKEADVILVMRDGCIVEQGDHQSLLAQNGFYAELYNSQFEP